MVQHVSRQFCTAGTRPYGFMVEKVVLDRLYFEYLKFLSPLGIILPISLLRVLGDRKQCWYL